MLCTADISVRQSSAFAYHFWEKLQQWTYQNACGNQNRENAECRMQNVKSCALSLFLHSSHSAFSLIIQICILLILHKRWFSNKCYNHFLKNHSFCLFSMLKRNDFTSQLARCGNPELCRLMNRAQVHEEWTLYWRDSISANDNKREKRNNQQSTVNLFERCVWLKMVTGIEV